MPAADTIAWTAHRPGAVGAPAGPGPRRDRPALAARHPDPQVVVRASEPQRPRPGTYTYELTGARSREASPVKFIGTPRRARHRLHRRGHAEGRRAASFDAWITWVALGGLFLSGVLFYCRRPSLVGQALMGPTGRPGARRRRRLHLLLLHRPHADGLRRDPARRAVARAAARSASSSAALWGWWAPVRPQAVRQRRSPSCRAYPSAARCRRPRRRPGRCARSPVRCRSCPPATASLPPTGQCPRRARPPTVGDDRPASPSSTRDAARPARLGGPARATDPPPSRLVALSRQRRDRQAAASSAVSASSSSMKMHSPGQSSAASTTARWWRGATHARLPPLPGSLPGTPSSHT